MIPLFDSYALRPLQAEDASDIFRAFEKLAMQRIEIRCATGNLPSNRIPRRLGMRLDRIEPHAEQLSSGEWVDLNVYVAERSEQE